MKAISIAVALLLTGCAVLDEDERVANLEGRALEKHCKNISGEHSCGATNGFEISTSWEEQDCVDNITEEYAACSLTVAEQQACVDAIRDCDAPDALAMEGNVCQPWIDCILFVADE